MKFAKINIKNFKITPEFARLHAHICGDGSIYRTKTNRSKKELEQHPRKNTVRNRFNIRYCNDSQILLNQFLIDFKNLFNRKAILVSKGRQMEIQGKWLYDLFKYYGAGKSKEWSIHKEIIGASDKIKSQWLMAFFDDEAHVSKTRKRIVLNIVNLKGLKQIKKLLNDMNINSKLNGPYFYKEFYSYHLTIYKSSIQKYSNFIGFTHPKKRKDLYEIVKNMGTQGIS
ncbi:MAG: LAGLIDADG family homing endonuclease [Nanoarchaeota archaeon]|nr:LAGLIDADG family homing endonuclease [Nanoarchaeota archaeon]